MPTSPVGSTSMPLSSLTSRTTVWAIDSPKSIAPPGSAHRSLSVRRWSRISPALLATTAVTAATIEFGAGASGSFKCSILAISGCLLDRRSDRLRAGPDGLEGVRVGVEEAAGAEPAPVQHGRLEGVRAPDVGVHEHVVVEAEDRVVERRAVQGDLDVAAPP